MATVIRLGGKDYTIKFGYGITAKTDIVSKVMQLGKVFDGASDNDVLDNVNFIVTSLAEFILVGLQKNHKDEFGYDYNTGKGKVEKLDIVYDLLDDYFDDGGDFAEMYNKVQEELLSNGFLANMLQTAETTEVAQKSTKSKK